MNLGLFQSDQPCAASLTLKLKLQIELKWEFLLSMDVKVVLTILQDFLYARCDSLRQFLEFGFRSATRSDTACRCILLWTHCYSETNKKINFIKTNLIKINTLAGVKHNEWRMIHRVGRECPHIKTNWSRTTEALYSYRLWALNNKGQWQYRITRNISLCWLLTVWTLDSEQSSPIQYCS